MFFELLIFGLGKEGRVGYSWWTYYSPNQQEKCFPGNLAWLQ